MDNFPVQCPLLLQLYTNFTEQVGNPIQFPHNFMKIYCSGDKAEPVVSPFNNCRVFSAIAATAASNTTLFAFEGLR